MGLEDRAGFPVRVNDDVVAVDDGGNTVYGRVEDIDDAGDVLIVFGNGQDGDVAEKAKFSSRRVARRSVSRQEKEALMKRLDGRMERLTHDDHNIYVAIGDLIKKLRSDGLSDIEIEVHPDYLHLKTRRAASADNIKLCKKQISVAQHVPAE